MLANRLLLTRKKQIPAGPSLRYSMQLIAGATLVDESGNGFNGTIAGAFQAPGPGVAKCLDFTTGDHQVSIPNTFQPDRDITISAWVQIPAGAPTVQHICLSFGTSATGRRRAIWVEAAGGVPFRLSFSGFSANILTTAQKLNDSVWRHVVITINASGTATVFVNMVSVGAGTPGLLAPGSWVNYLGRSDFGGGEFATCRLGPVTIYPRVLNSAEIAQLYDEVM